MQARGRVWDNYVSDGSNKVEVEVESRFSAGVIAWLPAVMVSELPANSSAKKSFEIDYPLNHENSMDGLKNYKFPRCTLDRKKNCAFLLPSHLCNHAIGHYENHLVVFHDLSKEPYNITYIDSLIHSKHSND